jgi:hypothetical protein
MTDLFHSFLHNLAAAPLLLIMILGGWSMAEMEGIDPTKQEDEAE